MLKPKFDPVSVVEHETEWSRRRKASRAEAFVFGPIAIRDIQTATKLGGSALAVLLALFFRCGVKKTRTVTLPSALLAEFGINRDAKLRALKHLEQAKLIDVKRRAGHTAVISLCTKKRGKRHHARPPQRDH
jgi:hypothetical protein